MGPMKDKKKTARKTALEIGWREEVVLPQFTRRKIKVKVDTGARTSALHVTNLEIINRGRSKIAKFTVHPEQDSSKPAYKCEAKVIEVRKIKSSTGHATLRPVIETEVVLGGESFVTELPLVNRELMGFRMLLGRKALKKRFVVNVAKSYMGRKWKRSSR